MNGNNTSVRYDYVDSVTGVEYYVIYESELPNALRLAHDTTSGWRNLMLIFPFGTILHYLRCWLLNISDLNYSNAAPEELTVNTETKTLSYRCNTTGWLVTVPYKKHN